MAESANLEVLSTRSGFNSAVRHIKKTMAIADDGGNLGDIIYEMDDEELTSDKIGLLLRMFLVDKLGYKAASANLTSIPAKGDISSLAKEFSKWNGVDLVAAYYHPEMGLLIANPKVAEELATFGELKKRELLVVYAGYQGKETDEKCEKAANIALSIFEGSKATAPAALKTGRFTAQKVSKPKKAEPSNQRLAAAKQPRISGQKALKAKAVKVSGGAKQAAVPAHLKKPAAVQASPGGPKRMTPKYAVLVTNELFHNGNVEAWKKIIASYKAKHPTLEVFIYYENERILDINSLFKWGKVKRNTNIEFAVAGDNIQDVAKLQRYLAQGASHMFEAFLKGPVHSVLNLF